MGDTTEYKKWYLSKTMIINTLISVFSLIAIIKPEWGKVLNLETATLIAVGVTSLSGAVINLGLRKVTDTPITFK